MATLEPISSVVLSSNGTVTFSSIPQDYQHLELRGFARANSANNLVNLQVRLNGVSSSSYFDHRLNVETQTTSLPVYTSQNSTVINFTRVPGTTATANKFGGFTFYISDYTSTNKNKNVSCFGSCDLLVGLYSGTLQTLSPVTEISIVTSCVAGSVFSLYGIRGS